MEEKREGNRLAAVYQLGQSIWYDNIRRSLITSGELQRLIQEDSVVGVTSNPTIFEKAIDDSSDYDESIRELVGRGIFAARQIYEELATSDIQMAADILRPTYDRTGHLDGYISLEVSPDAAHDTHETISQVRHLFHKVDRPNVMIKIPATAEGLPAIEQMIYEGVNINVTLIFALEVYERVAHAYIRGLEHRRKDGLATGGIASVASFFVSRVDTLVDTLLQAKIQAAGDEQERAQLESLLGKAAIANARLAYARFREIFHGPQFAALAEQGATPQRCLWASTSTKNPAYSDVMYVEELIGPETVDTMPPATITAFADHGRVSSRLEEAGTAAAEVTMQSLEGARINMGDVTKQLEIDGVKAFFDSYNSLIDKTESKVAKLRAEAEATPPQPVTAAASPPPETVESPVTAAETTPATTAQEARDYPVRATLGPLQAAVDTALAWAVEEQVATRVWEKDPNLWKPKPANQSEITDRLGWLTVLDQMAEALPRLDALRDDAHAAGIADVVVLGMGGSSLAPEVFGATFGSGEGLPRLHVLDSTDPATILGVERDIDLPHSLFVVASKTGGTIETLSQFKYFFAKMDGVAPGQAGSHFIAITDPGTPLERLAATYRFRDTFLNPTDIGGRYSALSFFGLVPAALIGVNVAELLERARSMRFACRPEAEMRANPGLWLGTVMGTLAGKGRDKVTLVLSPSVATFGYWVEQLIAESTGKEGKGILPVEGEALGTPADYGNDRLFVYLRSEQESDPAQDEAIKVLEEGGHPVVTLALTDTYDLGGEFFRWEFATAVAGAFLHINAFDQPNVQEAKDKTNDVLRIYEQTGSIPDPKAILRTQRVSIVVDEQSASLVTDAVSLQAAIEQYLRQAEPGDYVALLAYIQRTPETETTLQHIRQAMRDLRRVATTLGYGPRFQHSTGQLHKGGANNGIFFQLVAADRVDAAIPDAPYTFSVLKAAQALGDLQALEEHKRRVIRVNLGSDIGEGLGELRQAVDAARLG